MHMLHLQDVWYALEAGRTCSTGLSSCVSLVRSAVRNTSFEGLDLSKANRCVSLNCYVSQGEQVAACQ